MTVCEGATGETEQVRKDEGLPQLRPTLVDTVKRRICIHEQFSLKKIGLDFVQRHPLHRMRFNQYQASSAALG